MRLSRLFGIGIVHPYFGSGPCTALSLRPTPACLGLMQQYGLYFQPLADGGAVFCRDPQRAATYASPQPLDFTLYNSDPALLNYSAIDQSALSASSGKGPALSDTLFYADNLGSAAGALCPDFADSALILRPSGFTVPLAAPVSAARVAVMDALGQPRYTGTTPEAPQAAVPLALGALPAGRYSVRVDDATVLDFYLQPQPCARSFGVLAVYPGGPLQAPLMDRGCPAIAADGSLTDRQYTFTLAPRATVWRYHVFSSNLQLGAWTVQAAAPGDAAGPSFVCTNPDATAAPWIFESQQPIAMAAFPDAYRITLNKPVAAGRKGRGGQKIALPYARGASLVQPGADPLGGTSDIFVYL